MTRIGFLHTRKDPQQVPKLYAYAAAAKAEGVEFFYFTAGRVDLTERSIRGCVYENGAWVERKFLFPDVILNDSSPVGAGAEVIHELSKIIPFASHSAGSKMTVHERIKKGSQFSQYQIPSLEVRHAGQVMNYLAKHGSLVFKPVWGHRGIGVLRLEKQGRQYVCQEGGTTTIFSIEEVTRLLQERLDQVTHLVQPFLVTQTQDGRAYDFRLHVRKNGSGNWVITSISPRIAPSGSFITNLHSGGYAALLDPFLEHEFGEQAYDVQRELEQFGLALAAHMDDIYGVSFDELSIDAGLDEKQKIWLFDVNWQPDVPPLSVCDLDTAKHAIGYAVYLAGRGLNR